MKTSHEMLVDARNILGAGRWCRRAYTDDNGNFCASGALLNAAGLLDGFSHIPFLATNKKLLLIHRQARRALGEALNKLYPRYGHDIAKFNDDHSTKLEQVLEVFDEAIRRTAPEPINPAAELDMQLHDAELEMVS